VADVFTASTHDYILFFTNTGRVHRRKGYMIPEAGRTARGTNIVNVLPIEAGERVTAMLHTRELSEDRYLFMITKNGTVKRLAADSLRNIRSVGIRALNLDEGDELISVRETDGNQNILLMTHNGMSICFQESDVRAMGREAVGVRGIRLRQGDWVVAGVRAVEGRTLLAITENGYGKRTDIAEYLRGDEPQNRGGYGLKGYQVTEKTGPVAGAKVVSGDEDVLLISDDGTIIRMATADVNIYSRAAQGVRLMRIAEGTKVTSLARAEKEPAEGEEEAIPTEEE
jgi:DNA gyrase subunit A